MGVIWGLWEGIFFGDDFWFEFEYLGMRCKRGGMRLR